MCIPGLLGSKLPGILFPPPTSLSGCCGYRWLLQNLVLCGFLRCELEVLTLAPDYSKPIEPPPQPLVLFSLSKKTQTIKQLSLEALVYNLSYGGSRECKYEADRLHSEFKASLGYMRPRRHETLSQPNYAGGGHGDSRQSFLSSSPYCHCAYILWT